MKSKKNEVFWGLFSFLQAGEVVVDLGRWHAFFFSFRFFVFSLKFSFRSFVFSSLLYPKSATGLMQDPRAAVSAACCCCCCCCEEEEGSLLLLLLPSLSFPPPALSSLTSKSSGQFFPVMNSLARRDSGGVEASREPSSTAMPFKTSICPCGLDEENGADAEAAAARALGLRSGASTHPTTAPESGSTRATQGVPQTFAQSSPSAREALPMPLPPLPVPLDFLPPPSPPPRPKGNEDWAAFASAVSFEASAAAAAAEEEEEEEEDSRDLTAPAGTHSSSLRLKTSTLFFFPSFSLPLLPSSPPSSSVTVIVLRALETSRASANVILEEPSERATAEAAGTKAAPQPSPSGVLVSSETGLSEELPFFEFAPPPPARRLRASSMAPPSASTGFFGPILLSEEFKRASASCQKALPESQVSWRSLEEEPEVFLSPPPPPPLPPPEKEGTFVRPSPKASSGSLAVLRGLPDSRSTSLTVDLPLRPGMDGIWREEREVREEREEKGKEGEAEKR